MAPKLPPQSKIAAIRVQPLSLKVPFVQFAAHFAAQKGSVLLLSGGDLDCARYHIMGVQPWLSLRGRGHAFQVKGIDWELPLQTNPLEALEGIIRHYKKTPAEQLVDSGSLPLTAGLLGYLSYDIKDHIEDLPRTSMDDLALPSLCLYAHKALVIHDKKQARTWLSITVHENDREKQTQAISERIKALATTPAPKIKPFKGDDCGFQSNLNPPDYMTAIDRIKAYISAGDVYQVNMSQRFAMPFGGNPYDLFQALYSRNPAPFFAYINANDHQIVSTSPERFLLQQGRRVETRPIKGTRPRGQTPEKDRQMRRELLGSPKDDAELSMIVDLLRNDIGKVCAKGSVTVSEHKRLEAYQNVYHLVSRVEGRLDRGKGAVDLIKATFPGGSITGCPKIRSMEIIDELEPHRRHIYTGSIGYIGFQDTMDLSIAIRTATIINDRILFSVGGGIVFDSDSGDEYDETLHKGRSFLDIFDCDQPLKNKWTKVWINGVIKNAACAAVPITDLGLQYGFGFFETMRAQDGRCLHVKAHLQRFKRTWKALMPMPLPDLTWPDVIGAVLTQNHLMKATAAVKLLATRGTRSKPPFDYTLAVSARPYVPPISNDADTDGPLQGLHLGRYPYPRQSPLADHKTLNYLYYLNAGEWAREKGYDEALIVNPDQSVSETSRANLILIIENTAVLPASPHVLPGVMQELTMKQLKKLGFEVIKKKVSPHALFKAHQVLLTNALMGSVPALSLSGRPLNQINGLSQTINSALWSP